MKEYVKLISGATINIEDDPTCPQPIVKTLTPYEIIEFLEKENEKLKQKVREIEYKFDSQNAKHGLSFPESSGGELSIE